MNKKVKRFLKKFKFIRKVHQELVGQYLEEREIGVNIDEITPLYGEKAESSDKIRINILVPTLKKDFVFGGISTALKFFDAVAEKGNFDKRIITTDSDVHAEDIDSLKNAIIVKMNKDSKANFQVVACNDRQFSKLKVRKKDIFIATSWWSAYILNSLIKWQNECYDINNPMIYLIQDYEPGFYPWSSRYLLADSTYKNEVDTIAVFNTKILYDFFKVNGYEFAKEMYFEATLNETLSAYIDKADSTKRKKQLIVYGRPSVDRNCFEIIVGSLRALLNINENARNWEYISLGELHKDIELGFNKKLVSKGKVTLEDYANIMMESSIGLSLMNSPHPSYPPLEMSTFGVKTVTNTYANKDLKDFNNNIISVENCSYENIANELSKLVDNAKEYQQTSLNTTYLATGNNFVEISGKIYEELTNE